jgi:hypothetical protein
VATNGNRRPPRPRIEMLGAAEPQEAAAVIAAVEQFLADTAPAPAPEARVNPWQRAALLEGVRAKQAFASPWGEPRTWGERHTHAPGPRD